MLAACSVETRPSAPRPWREAATWRWGPAPGKAGLKLWALLRPVLPPPAGPWDPKSQAFGGFLLGKDHGGVPEVGGLCGAG